MLPRNIVCLRQHTGTVPVEMELVPEQATVSGAALRRWPLFRYMKSVTPIFSGSLWCARRKTPI
jgi:hypothetical protein